MNMAFHSNPPQHKLHPPAGSPVQAKAGAASKETSRNQNLKVNSGVELVRVNQTQNPAKPMQIQSSMVQMASDLRPDPRAAMNRSPKIDTKPSSLAGLSGRMGNFSSTAKKPYPIANARA